MTEVRFGGEELREGSSQSGGERDHLFFGRAGKQFVDVSFVSGADHPGDARSAAVWDYDRDGRPDLVLANANAPLLSIFHNEIESGAGFIALRFVGANHTAEPHPDRSARDAYGAKVTVDLGDLTITREHRAGEQLGGQNSATMLIGIGAHIVAPKVTVRFPSGRGHTTQDVPSGTLLTVYEDLSQSPIGEAFLRRPYARPQVRAPEPPRPRFALHPPDDAPRAKVTLYVIMATWCPACTREIVQERALRAAFPPADLRLFGVPIDETEGRDKLAAYMAEQKPAYRLLDPPSTEDREALRRHVKEALRVDAIPATVAVDAEGRVLATYRGVPSVSEVRKLLAGL